MAVLWGRILPRPVGDEGRRRSSEQTSAASGRAAERLLRTEGRQSRSSFSAEKANPSFSATRCSGATNLAPLYFVYRGNRVMTLFLPNRVNKTEQKSYQAYCFSLHIMRKLKGAKKNVQEKDEV